MILSIIQIGIVYFICVGLLDMKQDLINANFVLLVFDSANTLLMGIIGIINPLFILIGCADAINKALTEKAP